MKKYIIPATKVYNVHPSTLLANSTTQTLSSGGSNSQTGAPTAAEAHEWRGTSTVMGNEW